MHNISVETDLNAFYGCGKRYFSRQVSTKKLKKPEKSSKVKQRLTVSQELLNAIMAEGYSLYRVAKEIHVSIATLRRIHSGKVPEPAIRTFSRILGFYCRVCLKNDVLYSNILIKGNRNLS